MKKYIFTTGLVLSMTIAGLQTTFADTEVACSSQMQSQYSCNQCFDAGYIYEGNYKELSDVIKNTDPTGKIENYYYQDKQVSPVVNSQVQNAVIYTVPEFQYASPFFTNTLGTWYQTSSNRLRTYLKPGDAFRWLETIPWKGLQVTSVNKSLITDANRTAIRDANFVVQYSSFANYFNTASSTWAGTNTHIECQQIGVHFCGDGVVESGKETCDPADPKKTNWGKDGCNTSCQPVNNPVPTCDSISASPTFGSTPLTTTLTCSGSNLPAGSTYSIDCGNGTSATMTGNKGVCTYTNTSTTDSKTYTPVCKINGTITAPACQMNVGVNPAPQSPVCNPAKTGTQTAPVSSTDTLCTTGTASGFASTQNGNTTNYTWSCNNTTSVNCSANYTPQSGNFDLKIKKYAKSEDVFASVEKTEDFNYTIVVENIGPGKATGITTVKDVLPPGVKLRATPSGNGWTCTGSAGDTAFTCTTDATVNAKELFNVITVPASVKDLVFRNDGYVNYAYVQNPNEMDGKQCNTNNAMPAPTNAGDNGQNPVAVCNEDKNNFDPATINPPNPNGFDLRLKKFVNGDDESASVNADGTVTYTFSVQNLGEMASSGKTTVSDSSFPDGITIASIATTQGEWTCTKDAATKFTCTTEKSLAKGEFATNITLTANVPSGLSIGSHRNVACLSNPYDPNEGQVLDPSTGKYKVNNCDPAEVDKVDPNTFDLSLKKYVADLTTGTPQRDGDHQTSNDGTDVDRDILTVPQGGKMRYRFVVKNLWPITATGTTTVEDTLPNDTSIVSVSGTGWSCQKSEDRKFKCTRTDDLAVGASFPEIVVDAQASSTILAGEYSNTATLKNPGDTNPNNNQDPANIEIVLPGFDLSIKKYIGDNDAQIGSGLTKNTNDVFNYVIRVKNEGPATTTGTTVVRDTLPSGVELSGAISGTNWTATYNSGTRLIEVTTTQQVVSGAYFSDIIVPIRVTAGSSSTVTNYAVVYNKDEKNACKTDATMPAGNETACANDSKNIDPAVFNTQGGTGGGSFYYTPKCINNLYTCETVVASSQPAGSYTSFDLCKTSLGSQYGQSCGGGNGGTGGGGSTPGYCGDGVLQPGTGEECDVKWASWCDSQCKILGLTTPGANPITDLWITIPTLSTNARFGYDWIDGEPGKLPFSANGVVTGVQGKVFTLADTVGFGIRTQYQIPLIIEADKKICLQGNGANVDNNTICTTFGEAANSSMIWTRPTDGKKFVIIGKGEYQYQNTIGGVYYQATANQPNNIDLFHGSVQYQTPTGNASPTLNSAFHGVTAGTDARISLIGCAGTDCSAGAIVSLATMPVRVSSAMVGTSGTPVNRSIAQFVITTTTGDVVNNFLKSVSTSTTMSTTTTSTANMADITVNGAKVGDVIASKIDDIPMLNGNPNIRAVKGNLTIDNCYNSTFVMDGIRTVIVEGNITFKCNTAYTDSASSWAWIAKGGNILIDNGDGTPVKTGITNLAWVYVAIGDTTTTGQFKPLDGKATNAILKIDGSLYGNANPLFNSRLYARGTSAYDILTTGTIITYSNRALTSPPPLLSQYLSNYDVQRVVK